MGKLINLAIDSLITDRKFSVARQGHDIILIKMISKRPVTIRLRYVEKKGFWIEPATMQYRCTTSHFEYSQEETRFTRRKNVIIQLVQELQKTDMWEYILNKKFFVPNEANKAVSRKVVEAQYKSILAG